MITWIRFDWKEQLTINDVVKALIPHGLVVKEFENGDEFEFVICNSETTDDQIVENIINDFDSTESPDELRKTLKSFLKEVRPSLTA